MVNISYQAEALFNVPDEVSELVAKNSCSKLFLTQFYQHSINKASNRGDQTFSRPISYQTTNPSPVSNATFTQEPMNRTFNKATPFVPLSRKGNATIQSFNNNFGRLNETFDFSKTSTQRYV